MSKAWFRTKSECTHDGQLWHVVREVKQRTATIMVFRDGQEVVFLDVHGWWVRLASRSDK